ncbi:UvrD-helicase domain-containing protein [Galbitalea soli]|uniref:UvrD-helicase domain-containing protein n=1 Tax=Galbitalea soli TaxID=1268042 RepID=A0A7C9PNR0_9MICO|nr:UvrD-helicase domain-containing protein [Galbitalea soli]NEM91631.1 UvrD-helicase domain-containing protein [Galbitalea soli]NYJ30326.1 superfamily I DNA/RNA helicase [Galbitalea soli]
MTIASSDSAGSRRELVLAEGREHAVLVARQAAARAALAPTERDVITALSPLTAVGFTVLPVSSGGSADLVVVGPSGVFIVDTNSWADLAIENRRILRHGVDVTADLDALADLAFAAEAALAEIGLAPGEIHPLVVLAGAHGIRARIGVVELVGEQEAIAYILGHGTRLTPEQVDAVLTASLDFFERSDDDHLAQGDRAPEQSTIDELDTIPLLSNAEVSYQLQTGLAASRIEPWMSFLTPEQARLARRSFDGPSRIRGAAGTGKTVTALHRAAHLARTQPGIVLVTSYVSTLPAVLASQLERMAPEIRHRVEFMGTHAFAKRLLSDRGIRCNLQPAIADAEFEVAWRTVGRPGLLGTLSEKYGYWDDEIEKVIKGRGIETFDQYASLSRVGRSRALSSQERAAVWELYLAYQKRMEARGAHDQADLIRLAERSLRDEPLTRYAAVIADEAQDLSAEMVRMLHHLVGDAPDGLTLVGDAQQSIYPGGYRLEELGISVAGRSVSLSRNVGTAPQITRYAEQLVADDVVDDMEGGHLVPEPAEPSVAPGVPPLVVRFSNRAAHDAELPRRVREIVSSGSARLGDIGVVAPSTFAVRSAMAALQKANIPIVELSRFDGRPVDAVKVGTVSRAKGLHFEQVLLVQVPTALIPDPATVQEPVVDPTRRSLRAAEAAPRGRRGAARAAAANAATRPAARAAREESILLARELYAAATRARSGLWIGTIP